jgi:hypothetical protein
MELATFLRHPWQRENQPLSIRGLAGPFAEAIVFGWLNVIPISPTHHTKAAVVKLRRRLVELDLP